MIEYVEHSEACDIMEDILPPLNAPSHDIVTYSIQSKCHWLQPIVTINISIAGVGVLSYRHTDITPNKAMTLKTAFSDRVRYWLEFCHTGRLAYLQLTLVLITGKNYIALYNPCPKCFINHTVPNNTATAYEWETDSVRTKIESEVPVCENTSMITMNFVVKEYISYASIWERVRRSQVMMPFRRNQKCVSPQCYFHVYIDRWVPSHAIKMGPDREYKAW